MAKNGKNGGEYDGGEFDHVIEFTPDAGFDIRHAARHFSKMMEELGLPLVMHLAHVSVEFEPGCTPKEIVDGYHQAMAHKVVIRHSNSNDTGKPPKR